MKDHRLIDCGSLDRVYYFSLALYILANMHVRHARVYEKLFRRVLQRYKKLSRFHSG
jgi:hypothetical protein